MKTITCAIKKPGERWEKAEVKDKLRNWQRIVGGYIEEFLSIPSGITGIAMFCNEDGKLLKLNPNVITPLGEVIVGTIFAVRFDEAGEFQSLMEEDLRKLGIEREA